jgi:tRNA1Val (adenine37-N6)-methyltransferase
MSEPFKFKQFSVKQDNCAMKIGTDGVMLGAWSSIEHKPVSILDIGSGTGIISLMLAQRSNAQVIEAIEIDADAYEQCAENFENSPWNDRLFCYHASLLEFVEEVDNKYDSIICNPPFYSEDFKTNNKARDLARFNDAMPFEHLVYAVGNILSPNGVFSTIIPFKEESKFINLANQTDIKLIKLTRVKGHNNSEFKRSLMAFSFQTKAPKISELIIENSRHNYTDDYVELTKDFYLKM